MIQIPKGKSLGDLIIIIVGTLLALHLFSTASFSLSALEIQLDLSLLERAQTSLVVKPMGQIQAHTHSLPVHLQLSLEGIHLQELEEAVVGRDPQHFFHHIIKHEGRKILQWYLLRLLLVGGMGGGIAIFLWSREKKKILEGICMGLLLTAAVLFSLYSSFTVEAFSHPEFTGMLEAAPWMLSLVEEGLQSIHQLGDHMRILARNLEEIVSSVSALHPPGIFQNQRRILHVSDIHNNPVAFPLIEEIIRNFQVDWVIDTGDLTDYGSALEAEMAGAMENLPVPYLFIPGNHDSPAVIAYLEELKNVTVLTGGTVNKGGLLITGSKDPSAVGRGVRVASQDLMAQFQSRLTSLVAELDRIPDLVAVHNLQMAEPLIGEVPVILHGHSHSPGVTQKGKTTLINAGTTGAAGIRGLEGEMEIPYSLALLHYGEKPEGGFVLTAVDMIRIPNEGSGFHLERQLIAH